MRSLSQKNFLSLVPTSVPSFPPANDLHPAPFLFPISHFPPHTLQKKSKGLTLPHGLPVLFENLGKTCRPNSCLSLPLLSHCVRRGLIGLITSGFPLRLHVQFRLHVFSPYSFPFDTTTSVRHGSNNTHHVSMLPSRRPWSSIVPAALVFLLSLVLSLFVGWFLENPV